jgi:hypothetical protein
MHTQKSSNLGRSGKSWVLGWAWLELFSSFLHMMVLSCSAPLFFFFFGLAKHNSIKKGLRTKSLVLFCGVTLLPTVAGLASD